jgi:hypothetical protein
MRRADEPVRAIGQLSPDGIWVGIEPAVDGYRLVFGHADGPALRDPTTDPFERRAGLVAAAISYFLASLADPPSDLEATQADLAHLVGSLSGDTREALDAIDDGLSGEAVAIRLQRLLPTGADPTRILRDRYARLGAR